MTTNRPRTLRICVHQWLAAKRLVLSESTWVDYAEKAERYIVAPLGHQRLRRIGPQDVLRFYQRLEGRGLSPRTVRYIHEILAQKLDYAVSLGLIPMNPARQVRPNGQQRVRPARLSPEDLDRFLHEASSDEFWPLWLLLASTGMRPSEALALLWGDLIPERGTVHVGNTLRVLFDGRWQRVPLRFVGQRREVPLPERVWTVLRQQQERQNLLRSTAGEDWHESHLVFTGTTGRPLIWARIARSHFKPLLRQAGLPNVPAFSLRHTYVEALLRSGADLLRVSQQTGYTSLARLVSAHGPWKGLRA